MKKELIELRDYCKAHNIKWHIFSRKTGDGWVSSFGYNIYIHLDHVDDEIKRILKKFKRGIYENTFILKGIGGNKYRLTEEEIRKIKDRLESELRRYKKWMK